MRSTLLLALVAVVVVVSGADARSSASADAAADVRLLARKDRGDPSRAVSKCVAGALPVGGEHARPNGTRALSERAPGRDPPGHRAPRPAQRAHGPLPGGSGPRERPAPLPAAPVPVQRRAPCRRRRGQGADRLPRRGRRGHADRAGPPACRTARAARQRLEPAGACSALRARRRGARRARPGRGCRSGRVHAREPQRRTHRAHPDSSSRPEVRIPVRGSALRPLPVRSAARIRGPSTWPEAPGPCGRGRSRAGRAVYVGYNSVRSPTPSFLRRLDAPRPWQDGAPRHRGRAAQRRRGQHDVRRALDRLPVEGCEPAAGGCTS